MDTQRAGSDLVAWLLCLRSVVGSERDGDRHYLWRAVDQVDGVLAASVGFKPRFAAGVFELAGFDA